MEAQAFNFQKARNVSETINATFAFIRQEFKPLGKAILYMVGPVVLITSYFSSAYLNGLIQGATQSPQNPMAMLGMLQSPYYWGTVALQVLGYVLNMMVVTYYIRGYIQNNNTTPSINSVWIYAINDLPRIFFYVIVEYIVVIIGTFALIIPGIYLGIGLTFFILVAIHERPGLTQSLSRSLKLIKNYWWFTVGVIILISIIAMVLQMVVEMPFYITGIVAGLNMKGQITPEAVSGWTAALAVVLNLATLLYGIVFVTLNVHYFSQLEKKEASGLYKQIEGMEGH